MVSQSHVPGASVSIIRVINYTFTDIRALYMVDREVSSRIIPRLNFKHTNYINCVILHEMHKTLDTPSGQKRRHA
jgi:hypothetical protein